MSMFSVLDGNKPFIYGQDCDSVDQREAQSNGTITELLWTEEATITELLPNWWEINNEVVDITIKTNVAFPENAHTNVSLVITILHNSSLVDTTTTNIIFTNNQNKMQLTNLTQTIALH